jgi:hypothetical protein
MTGTDEWAAEIGCTGSVLHTKKNESTVVESYCERKTARRTGGSKKFRSLQIRLFSSFGPNVVYL